MPLLDCSGRSNKLEKCDIRTVIDLCLPRLANVDFALVQVTRMGLKRWCLNGLNGSIKFHDILSEASLQLSSVNYVQHLEQEFNAYFKIATSWMCNVVIAS